MVPYSVFYDHVDDYTRMDLDFAADGNLRELSGEEAWEAIENFAQGQKEWDNPPNIYFLNKIARKFKRLKQKRLFGTEMLGEVPSFDQTKPQPQPLPNCLSLDVSLGEERGPEPPIKSHSLDSFRMKKVDSLTINTPPSPHVASSHPKDTYCYYRPCIDDPKKHYGFKPESKEVFPLEKELSLFDRPNEVERGRILEAHRLEPILQHQISQCMTPSHHDGRMVKATGIPVVWLPNKHQLKFNTYKSSKTLMEVIGKMFGGNKESKKVQKTLLKQQNKPDLEDLSMDDLYNNLKIYEAGVMGSSSTIQNTQNVAFLSSNSTSSTNEAVKTTHDVSATNSKALCFTLPNVLDKTKVECYNCHRRGHFARKCKGEQEQRTCKEEYDNGNNRGKSLVAQDELGYDWSDQDEEGPTNFALMAYTSSSSSSSEILRNEAVFKEDIKILKLDIMLRYNALTELRKKFEKAEKERDDLKLTLEKFEKSFKNLSKLLNNQISDNLKSGLRYDSQMFNSQVFDSEENDKYKTGEGYHVVPPYTRNFMPPQPDLVLADEDEYVFSKSVTSVPDIATSKAKNSESKPKESVSEPLIEDWISNSEDENETEPKSKQRKSSFAKVEFVKSNEHVKSPRESVKKVENNKQAKYPRKNSQSPRDCDFYEKKMAEKPVWNNAKRVNHQNSQRMTHPHPKRNFVPRAVLMKSGLKTLNTAGQNSSRAAVSVNTARPINTAYPRPTVNCARPASNVFNRAHSHVRRPFNKFTTNKNSNFNERVNTVRGNVTTVGPKAVVSDNKGNEANVVKASACWVWRPKQKVLDHVSRHNGASMNFKRFDYGNPQLELQEKGVIDSGCSRHMTGNMSYLFDYEEIDGGYVAFGGDPKGGKITGKGKIRTGKLDFKDVYFVKELKFNLFSLLDESQVLLRVPRKDNMYSVDLRNVVPQGGLTCLFAKATLDESNLWHRRLRHVNFKTMNTLVKGNLARGLPSNIFENDHTCVACQKGKQHKAFSTKDETSGILKAFITGIENQINHRVKIIRYDNGTEFKNKEMNQFCEMKGIKREFSVVRTPQQNGVAERKNRILIEAVRTMLADSKLPTTFWAKAVNTAYYLQNRVLVIKPHNKTPYELFHGRTPSLSFMRPFGCPVTILNTLDYLRKFDGKADEGFFVGYSVNSKAFKVFNSRTRIVEENLHITFLESKPNVAGSGPEWLLILIH
ncbi:putative ribonuclease H-like domain-containing protein [Tanacetum coccineum]